MSQAAIAGLSSPSHLTFFTLMQLYRPLETYGSVVLEAPPHPNAHHPGADAVVVTADGDTGVRSVESCRPIGRHGGKQIPLPRD